MDQNPTPSAGGQLPQQGLTPDQVRKMQVMAKQAMGFLLEGDHAEQIVARAKQGNAEQVIADAVGHVVQQLYQAAKAAGQDVDVVTMLVTGIQIIGDLAEMLVAAGVVQEADAAGFIGRVSKIAVDQHNAQAQQLQQQGGQQPQPAPAAGASMIGGASMAGGAA